MAPGRLAPLAALGAALLVFLGAGAGAAAPPTGGAGAGSAFGSGSHGSFSVTRLAQSAVEWRGGPITTSTGETVRVFVSTSLPPERAVPERWAELLARFTHGPELALLTAYIATLPEVQGVCGGRALGCYGRNRLIAPGEDVAVGMTGATAEEILRHEYGHHVAFHRSNAPWSALDWGPKRWASVADVCRRVARKEAFPGNQGANYALNPGEAWAETYRLMDERKAGITTATWTIVAPGFYPSEEALQAAEADVLDPWVGPRTTTAQRTFTRSARRVWLLPLSTPLDGELRLSVTLPRGGAHEVSLLDAARRTVLARGTRTGPRTVRLTHTVCGQRSVVVRVAQRGTLGRVVVAATTP